MLSLLFVFACSTEPSLMPTDAYDPGPQPVCEWTASPLGMDEDPGIGFTAAEVLANTLGPRSAPLKWDWTGETTVLDSELFEDGDPSWMTAEVVNSETGEPWVDEDGGTVDAESMCPSYLSLPVAWSGSTADGAFAVDFSARATINAVTVVSLTVEITQEDLGGSGIPMEIDPAEWDSVRFEFTVNVSPTEEGSGGSGGEIAVYADRVVESDEAVTDEGYINDVARWPWP